jgi:type VI secretion system protein ImpH
MAAEKRTPNSDLIDRLIEKPGAYEFFQIIRILEAEARASQREGRQHAHSEFGEDGLPSQEPARLRSHASLEFPEGDTASIELPTRPEEPSARVPPEVRVSFFGLLGPNGALPFHYTRRVIERLHVRFRDSALHHFFDLFTHRLVSFFIRAWRKYRLPFCYEQHQQIHNKSGETDPITSAFYALVGLGTPALRNRQRLPDEIPLFYGGFFARFPRSAVSLEAMLADYFGIEVAVEQFRGRWLLIDELQQSLMPTTGLGRNMALGESLLSGRRVWDVRSMFGIHLGPLSYQEFIDFMPIGKKLPLLNELVSLYVGAELEFEVECRLKAPEVPELYIPTHAQMQEEIVQDVSVPPMLGWNTWLETGLHAVEGKAIFR